MTAITQSIPFISADNTWESWNGSMLHYFGEEPLPYVSEDRWQEFARSMAGLTTFSSYGIPDPNGFDKWQDWTAIVIALVNGPTE